MVHLPLAPSAEAAHGEAMTQGTIVPGRAPPTDTETASTTPPAPQEPTGLTPPSSVRLAVWSMVAGALATLVAFLAWIPSTGGVRTLARDGAGEYAEVAGRVAIIGFWTAIAVTGVILVATWLWMARANSRGHVWARTAATVLVTVFSGFMILSAFGVADLALGSLGAWAAIVAWIAGLASVALLYRWDAVVFYARAGRA